MGTQRDTSPLYDDDGHTFAYERGESLRLALTWSDAAHRLTIRLAPGARPWGGERRFVVRVAGAEATTPVTFTGAPVSVRV